MKLIMKKLTDIRLSVLDLAPITEGSQASDAFRNSLDLARHVEQLGFHRYWVAEHHNMPGIASSATAVLIGHIASGTTTIRVGSGGIMLPNHAPLVVAEQFGTLETLYPNRIDLGLGRAPGTDQLTAQALRRDGQSGEVFPQLLEELRSYLSSEQGQVRAIPGEGLNIPIYLLGSSGFSARLAGLLGLPFAFASHFSPENTLPALKIYRDSFQPSEILAEPYVIVGLNVIAADEDEKAHFLATSQQQAFLSLIRRTPSTLKPPVQSMEQIWTPYEKMIVDKQLQTTMIGSPNTVKEKLQAFLDETGADEFMINTHIYDHNDRLRSYEIVSELGSGNH
ncbi:LLM class flavin-dependent oxidoreductase [Anaerobacillus isosaccharinicus]|uniref:LLM class flavin-dependent oxidoreductase n=1 Tax=Anaerobacillus isosaccharinicus TaxID=1532552 RepID=A0A1S2MEA4_9BACI|nr:LLM class flavin-dependent oxidoreductase [Anaerobacillus isosaccharinicus]MBA5586703.1 LLM class flavin-dependent oxidoreductase [Anaerobacillus isosaccharinicus]QOY38699.1 LLM class flavin-dependent oxidoreductase [Anaerobacillus isosaccharinicus]